MKPARLLILALAVMAGFALITVVWQAQTIRQLRADRAALVQDLQSVLAARLDQTPGSSAASTPEQQQLELIKLRHETRQLRESLVEARARQPTGLKGLLSPLLQSASSGTMQFSPEWQGMELHASNAYVAAMAGVTNGTNEYLRFLWLPRAAKMSLAVGRKDEARNFAEDAMALNEKYSHGSAEKLNGEVVHDANVVLGRIAVEEGRLEDAKRHLLAAGQTAGSPVLGSFGPNMCLAKDLLQQGEQATVLQYFELCRKFWGENEKLDQWKKDVEAGRIPEFGASLIH